MFRCFLTVAVLATASAPLCAQNAIDFGALDAYGNLQAGGVVASVSGDANRNAGARLEWRRQGDAAFRAGHPLVRVDATHFVGSLFWLDSGTSYEVRVTLTDPDGAGATPNRTVALTTRAEAGALVPVRTLYVAPNGNDDRDGSSPAQAVKTIQRGANLARAGDLVSIAAGVYRESVRVPNSGMPALPVVFRGAPGAVLDGADAAIAAGTGWNDGGGVWSRATGFATAHVVSDQGRLYRYSNLAELRALAAGAPGGFVFDGTTLSLKFSDGSAPAQRQIHVARLNEGFNLAGRSDVRIENLEIRHYGADPYGKGVYLRYSSNITLSGNRIHGIAAAGVWIKGGDRNLIERNDLSDSSIAHWPWGMSKGSGAENNAIVFTDELGRGNVIRRNTIHGTFNGIGACGSAPPPTGFSNETDIYENTFYDHADDATETEGYCSNVRLWDNRVRNSLMAFAIAPAGTGPVWILRNVAYDIGNTRSALQDGQVASGIKINSGYSTAVGPTFLYHNTFLTAAPDTDAIWLMPPGYSSGLVSRNNVYAGTDRAFVKDNPIALDLDYDALHTTGSSLVYWQGVHYADLAALQAGTGQEAHGIEAAPALGNPAQGDFMPNETSALIDRGLALPGINDGYGGTTPDIGALERNDPIYANGFD